MNDAHHVDRDDPFPIVELRIEKARRQAHARVVDEQVHGPRLSVHGRGEVAHLIPLGHVHVTAENAAAEGARGRLDAGEARVVDVADGQVGATARREQRGGAPDAASGPRHEDRSPVEVRGVHRAKPRRSAFSPDAGPQARRRSRRAASAGPRSRRARAKAAPRSAWSAPRGRSPAAASACARRRWPCANT